MSNRSDWFKRSGLSVAEENQLKADLATAKTALGLIHHATAPTHEDGAYHENAYSLATTALEGMNVK